MSTLSRSALALVAALSVATAGALAPAALAQAPAMGTKMVGGAAMYPTKTIVENAVASKDHTTLVAAVKQAGLVETLSGPGPFTVFAPTNAAFAKLPKAAVDGLMTAEGKPMLTKVLTYHVVAGAHPAAELAAMVKAGGGMASLTTVQGEKLMVMQSGDRLMVHDAKGGTSNVTIGDVMQSNGVIHVVDTVLMPN